MATNLSYTFQAMSSAGSSFSTPVEKPLSKKPEAVYETAVNTDEAVTTNITIKKKAPSQLMLKKGAPKVLGDFESFTETVSGNTSNFWLAVDVIEPMVLRMGYYFLLWCRLLICRYRRVIVNF